jgi:hypothetical protein
MLNNVGAIDRMIRVIFGSALLYLGLGIYSGSTLGIVLTVAAIVALLSGLFGSCLLYGLLGINTRETSSH